MVSLNFWPVVFLVDKFLARGGSWEVVAACGGPYDALDLTINYRTK